MNQHTMLRFASLGFVAALALAACDRMPDGAQADPAVQAAQSGSVAIDGSDIGGPFSLLNSANKPVRWSDFSGRYRLVYFGYTFCPDVCPLDVQRMAQAEIQLQKEQPAMAAKLQSIFITIDPERDTPDKVGEFTRAFSPKMVGLTGSMEQVQAAADAFKVYFSKGEELDGGGYLMGHSNLIYLMGPKGEPLRAFPGDQKPKAIAQELQQWIR